MSLYSMSYKKKKAYPYNSSKHLSPVFYFIFNLLTSNAVQTLCSCSSCPLLRFKGKFSGYREPIQIFIMKKLELSFISDILDSKLRN